MEIKLPKLPLEIIVRFGSENKIISIENNVCRVTIEERPENNKANLEIIKYFSKLLGKRIRIIKGLKSRRKVIDYAK